MTRSMTGYASAEGRAAGWRWSWELRSVNGRGLDLRLRLPEGIEGLEAAVRAALKGVLARGSVTVSLRLAREAGEGAAVLNPAALTQAIAMLREVEERAAEGDLGLRESSAAEILAIRGVLDTGGPEGGAEAAGLGEAILADLPGLVAAFDAMRAAEGAELQQVIGAQVDEIARLTGAAEALTGARAEKMRAALMEALARVMEGAPGAEEGRVAQELAMIAVKADVTEELDRLGAHVAAARELLAAPGPKGRKLDFLTQEFNREANTLCSKAQFAELTRVGLDLKHVIDQMREQVQNVE